MLALPEVAVDYEQVQKLAKERAGLEGTVKGYRGAKGPADAEGRSPVHHRTKAAILKWRPLPSRNWRWRHRSD